MPTTTQINGWSIPELADAPNIETATGWAEDVDGRVNPIFSTVAARDTAIPAPTQGQEAYVTATAEKYIFNGTAWIGMMPRFAYKTANESVTSSTAFQNDDHLLFTVEASSIYIARFRIYYANGDAASDSKYTLSVPASTTFNASMQGAGVASTDPAAATSMNVTYINSGGTLVAGVMSAASTLLIEAFITVSATPGTVNFQWAQNSSSGTALTLAAGSFLEVRKVG